MKSFINSFFSLIIAVILITVTGCKKDSFITSADALLSLSEDTLHFDTVFTSVGSATQYMKIFNLNSQKLKLSSVQLMGGTSSFFKLNVDGSAGTLFNDIEIAANDSLYLFSTVSINPTTANLPFVVRDSVKIIYNGNTKYLQLEAFGRNANFIRNGTVTKDTTWTNNLPIVVIGTLTVNETKTLTINKGCKIYLHADAPIIVNGTLNAIGEKYDSTRIIFQGDRLDEPYKDFPGSWPGIYFMQNSRNNVLQYCILKNGYQGTVAQYPSVNSNPKLTLNQCIFDNMYDAAIGGANSSINATNCLVSNCGYNTIIASGGNYIFNQCTLSSYDNAYVQHKNPVLTVSNTNSSNQPFALSFTINNSIIYGEGGLVDNEINVVKQGSTAFSATFNNVLYKVKTDPANATFTNSIKNQNPLFDSVNVSDRYFNFRLKATSPCINKGFNTGLLFDLDGNNRNNGLPDFGCYEKQ
jgi:hypothetical protein